ncbi:hypothetical protein HPB51_000705 [Rhipicephalus microplus]|uniref:Transposable element n=1 Tax=Rhipicephalus microplus TaxID=6941 RepID=A0A9J6D3M7_RHIMP|nr:hypothetical protein HPB51_000705 [Rhipicephalus microplus]
MQTGAHFFLLRSGVSDVLETFVQVCADHFDASCIEKTTSYTDPRTGRVIEVALPVPRLRPGSVPTVFPGCPSYLSVRDKSTRETPDAKRSRQEASQLARAVEESLASYEAEQERDRFSSLEELRARLQGVSVSPKWTVIHKEECSMFLNIIDYREPCLNASLTVFANLEVFACYQGSPIKNLGSAVVPDSVQKVSSLLEILNNLSMLSEERCTYRHLAQAIHSLLDKLEASIDEGKKETVNFMKEQLLLLSAKRIQYSAQVMVFACILRTISPHAYKFLRSTGALTLPHPSTIRKVCSSIQMCPQVDSSDDTFLQYVSKRFKHLQAHEHTVTLMLDEIYIKPCLDYKGGNICGAAVNSNEAATSVHVFMIQSLLSAFKEVAHILPVKALQGEDLHCMLKKVILGLEEIGYRVIAVVCDNNSLNRKAMKMFLPEPKLSPVYPHPADPDRPLFYVVDAVHLFKCIRNNWLNQKNAGTCFFYPRFELSNNEVHPECKMTASFKHLRDLHKEESPLLLKSGYGLTSKALNPSSFERHDVKLVLQVFNPHVAEALAARKGHTDFQHATATAEFIKIILRWWSIVNVKTPSKGFHHRNVYEEPMSNHTDDPKASFLSAFITWLDVWEFYRHDTGVLTQETLSALRLSAQSLLALVKYCVSELHFKYILLGKVQTDTLESRFGQYRQMAGGQYHISVRQLCETEGRIRLQNALPRMSNDDLRGIEETDSVRDAGTSFSVHVSDADLDELRAQMPVIGYAGGYCAHAAMKVLKCESCQRQLVVTRNTAETGEDTHSLIAQLDRGGLKFPSALVITVVMYTEVVVRKLMTESTSTQFLHGPNQKNVVRQLTLDSLPRLEDIDTCENGHTYELLITLVANCAANIMLNNLCKQRNDLLRIEKDQKAKNRKARIFLGK